MTSLRPRVARSCGPYPSSVFLSGTARLRPPFSHRQTTKHTRQLSLYTKARHRPYEHSRMGSSARVLCSRSARPRSAWGQASRSASFWSWRCQSSWHRPGCKWVRSEGDPRKTPRDKDCPACQEEASRPTELSHRELIWQRQMQFMKDFLERDPYEALFGRSNDRLRGLMPRSFWHEALNRPWSNKAWDLLHPPTAQLDGRKIRDSLVWDPRPWWKTRPHHDEATAEKNEDVQSISMMTETTNLPHGTVRGYGRWTVSSTNSSGKTSVESGEMVFDPITMRMVPLDPKKPAQAVTQPQQEPKAPETSKTSAATDKESVRDDENKNPSAPKASSTAAPDEPKAKLTSAGSALATNEEPATPQTEPANTLSPSQSSTTALNLKSSSSSNALSTLDKRQVALQTLKESETVKIIKHEKEPEKQQIPEKLSNSGDKESIKRRPKASLPIKEALEKSWLRKHDVSSQKSGTSGTDANSDNSDHLRQLPYQRDRIARQAFATLVKRDRALKHMSAHELGVHRAALLRSWARKHDLRKNPPTAAEERLNEEIKAQKLAMQALENKWRIRKDSSPSASPLDVSGTKWSNLQADGGNAGISPNAATFATEAQCYEKKTPHASAKEQEKSADRALVSTIKEIYETSYGVINENHRQGQVIGDEEKVTLAKPLGTENVTSAPVSSTTATSNQTAAKEAKAEPQQQGQKAKPEHDRAMYQILAYDPSTHSIHTAMASSSFCPPTGDRILSVSDALPRLHHPAKFLPYFSQHHADGYEIVSANKNLLVFKRTHPLAKLSSAVDSLSRSPDFLKNNAALKAKPASSQNTSVNPVDGTAFSATTPPPRPSTGNFASPTGFVNHDIYEAPSKPSSKPSRDNPRVRKEEAVFTGRPRKWSSAHSSPGGNGKPGSSNRFKNSNHESRSRSSGGRNHMFKKLALLNISGLAVVFGSMYMVGWWAEESKESSNPPSNKPTSKKPVTPSATVADKGESNDDAKSFRPGFWAAVNREQTRRADVAQSQRIKDAKTMRHEETKRKVTAVMAAGFDVALFGTLLWVFVKFIEASGR